MEKASRALRRSGVKLLSLPGGHGELNMLLSEMKDIRHSAKLLMNAQHLASQDMMKWAANEENRAIQDVISQVAELNLLWTEVQKIFIEHLKEYRHMFEQVLEGEKKVAEARTNLNYCEEKETKVKKECKKVAKRANSSELRIFETKISVAEKSREMAQLELTERLREHEAIKLIQMKSGMMKICEAYIEMSSKCNVLFTAQKNVVHQIPDVHTQEIETIKYTGSGTTRYIVQKARENIEAYTQETTSEPPPPYTPPEPGSGHGPVSAGVPQPAPRRTSSRDSNPAPVSNLVLDTNGSTEERTSETRIVHTHKVRVRIPDSPGTDCKKSHPPEYPDDYNPFGDDDDDDGDDDGGKDNVPLTNSSLYPALDKHSTDSSPKEKDRPVPIPRSRRSYGSDAGKDLANKTGKDHQVNAERNIDEKHDVTIDTGSAGSTHDAEKAMDDHATDDESSEVRVQDNLNKSETEHKVSTTEEITASRSDPQHAVSSNDTMNVNCDAVNEANSNDEIKDMETVKKVLNDDGGKKEGSHESSGNACDEMTINNS